MSLLSTASNWVNDENQTKKRTPMMRKTLKTKEEPLVSSYVQKTDEYQEYKVSQDKNEYVMHSITDVQKNNDEREDRVNQILNQMTSVSVENDGGYLADFQPPNRPMIHIKKDLQTTGSDDDIPDLQNDLQHKPQAFKQSYDPYMVSQMNNQNVSNYQMVYDPSKMQHKPYYSKMGITTQSGNPDKLLERINYMIHLLENQEYEKTANITEEFILYSFLGIFIIFVLDSFSRTAKYSR
uniref:Uncharacterized protein n=1 Tax=viral metagenome TaxID=1070528 RepID=A0A6C0I100_9ZZZZ